eukprot:TRINITY_DN5450_c0_g1_i1.p1 TRINITY_DN5450_c0_g1~~TRINITY_DN5450_c0_g1_i1.p1  ORF type:complete len:586 (-),score=157.07 TRINITY_DN5450_c0_g1_i1:92-1849(-)
MRKPRFANLWQTMLQKQWYQRRVRGNQTNTTKQAWVYLMKMGSLWDNSDETSTEDDLLEFTENTLKLRNNSASTTPIKPTITLGVKVNTQVITTTASTTPNANTKQAKKPFKATPNQILPDTQLSPPQKRVLFENDNPSHTTKTRRLSISSTTTTTTITSTSTIVTNEPPQNKNEEAAKQSLDDFSELLTLVQEDDCEATQVDDGVNGEEKIDNEKEVKKGEENNIDFENKIETKEEEEEKIETKSEAKKTGRKLPDWMLDPLTVQRNEENEARQYREKKDKFKEESTLPLYSLLFSDHQCEEIEELPTGRVICFDVETTGFGVDDSIIEIGAIEIVDGYRTGVVFQSYAQPRKPIHPMAFLAHQLSESMLYNSAPTLDFVIPNFLKFVGDSPLIAHNLHFDMRMLLLELERLNLHITPSHKLFCTMRYFRKKYPQRPYSLSALSIFFGIDQVIRRKTHGALVDSEILAQVYTRLLKLFSNTTHKIPNINNNHNHANHNSHTNTNIINNDNNNENENSGENGDNENIDQNENMDQTQKTDNNDSKSNEDPTQIDEVKDPILFVSPTQQETQLCDEEGDDCNTIPM